MACYDGEVYVGGYCQNPCPNNSYTNSSSLSTCQDLLPGLYLGTIIVIQIRFHFGAPVDLVMDKSVEDILLICLGDTPSLQFLSRLLASSTSRLDLTVS